MRFSKASRIKIGIGLAIVSLAGVFLLSGGEPGGNGGRRPGPQIATLKRGSLVQRISITGQINPKRRLDVRAPFTGYVAKLFVKIGAQVQAQAPLVTFAQNLAEASAAFPIRATFAGTVTQVLRSEGEYLLENANDNNVVMRIEDLSEFWVTATVPELDIAKVKVGQEAKVRISAFPGETFTAVIEQINLSAKDKDRWSASSTEFQVRARLKSRDPRMMTGLSVVMDVITDSRENALTLTHEYLVATADKSFVTLESGERRDVKVGLTTDEAVEIVEGLKEGDRVCPVDFLNFSKADL